MEITFLGGATTVTGSTLLITTDRARVLVDCGMFQGSPNESIRNRVPFGFDPATFDAVLLTHAHLDHCGRLPLLVNEGYGKTILATAGTCELASLVLLDSGHLHEEFAKREARWERRHPDEVEADDRKEAGGLPGGDRSGRIRRLRGGRRRDGDRPCRRRRRDRGITGRTGEHVATTIEPEPPHDWATRDPEAELRRQPPELQVDLDAPLYTVKDAQTAIEHFRPIDYDQEREVAPGVWATFLDAGHILGSAIIRLRVQDGGGASTSSCAPATWAGPAPRSSATRRT